MIKPTANEVTFGNYIELFKSTRVEPYFRFSTKVVLVFDSPKENSPKYMIRKYRDGNIISKHESINFNEETPIPPPKTKPNLKIKKKAAKPNLANQPKINKYYSTLPQQTQK